MRLAPIWGFFLGDRRFTVWNALIMRFARSRVLDMTGIIRAIGSVSPRFQGILAKRFSTNAVNFYTAKTDRRGLNLIKRFSEVHWLLFGAFP